MVERLRESAAGDGAVERDGVNVDVNDGKRARHRSRIIPVLVSRRAVLLQYVRIKKTCKRHWVSGASKRDMDGLRFERLKGEGHHYPVLLHIGSSYVPVMESTINELKACALLPGERFLDVFLDRLGYSDFLKERIRAELEKTGDPVTQATVLQGIVRDL